MYSATVSIHDLSNISGKLQFFLFADDINIYYESSDLLELEKTINHELKLLGLWLNFNCKQKQLNHNIVLISNRKALIQKDQVKYLGVLMDQHLTWNYQISHVSKTISRSVGIISKLRHFLGRIYCVMFIIALLILILIMVYKHGVQHAPLRLNVF